MPILAPVSDPACGGLQAQKPNPTREESAADLIGNLPKLEDR